MHIRALAIPPISFPPSPSSPALLQSPFHSQTIEQNRAHSRIEWMRMTRRVDLVICDCAHIRARRGDVRRHHTANPDIEIGKW